MSGFMMSGDEILKAAQFTRGILGGKQESSPARFVASSVAPRFAATLSRHVA